ncbi:MAG: hypothetical protein AB7F09_09850 [Parvibaculaceae bacterium]
MSVLPPLTPRDRRIRWLSLAALIVLLPVAIGVRSHGGVTNWRAEQDLDPLITAQPGRTMSYGGADWRLEGLYQLRQDDKRSAVVLAEFEARIKDPAVFAAGMCRIKLGDRGDKRWLPQFLMPYAVRKARPSVDERVTCGAATIKPLKAGETVKMAETFLTPAELTKVDLIVSAANVRPTYLVLR